MLATTRWSPDVVVLSKVGSLVRIVLVHFRRQEHALVHSILVLESTTALLFENVLVNWAVLT